MEGGKEEEEKLLSTKEAAETLKDKLSPRSESQSSFVRATNDDMVSNSVQWEDPDCSLYSYSAFAETELKCIAQVHHNLDWISKMDDQLPPRCQALHD